MQNRVLQDCCSQNFRQAYTSLCYSYLQLASKGQYGLLCIHVVVPSQAVTAWSTAVYAQCMQSLGNFLPQLHLV